ncbi:hypothetical protein ABCR94_19280 [Streptomyces sp. 21So2-11]|uniref:hypothetical protein n=1 Tax=Streptomyces sp. 21So2-11 TaxID=3144408 RepID=UPI003219E910
MEVHLDHTQLAELALARNDPEESCAETAHLLRCAHCRGELDALRRVVDAARAASPSLPLVPPPDHIWDAVAEDVSREP